MYVSSRFVTKREQNRHDGRVQPESREFPGFFETPTRGLTNRSLHGTLAKLA